MANKIFDFHFHLLFKHYITLNKDVTTEFRTGGVAKLLNDILGGPFDSQSSPAQVKDSQLFLGVTSIISLEHAFARRVLHLLGIDFSGILPLDTALFERTRDGLTDYFTEFKTQLQFYLDQQPVLTAAPFHIHYTGRQDPAWKDKTSAEIAQLLLNENTKRYLVFSIEGGHNLSDVPVRGTAMSRTPELNLLQLQERTDVDFLCMNLCHLSYIPEQPLGGFAQGLNKQAQIAFSSEDFMPKAGLGLTELGKKVIRQALTHPTRPVLIDVKHMSVYTRLHYYRFREQLINEDPAVERLPIISSHTGFTFSSIQNYLQQKKFRSAVGTENGTTVCVVEPENKKIGRTDDLINSGLFSNPWSINLFEEEITTILESKGMIGISLDQRILGAEKIIDSNRGQYFDGEYVAREEWEKLFRDGQLPGPEGLGQKDIAPSRAERHIMLLCMHIVYAVRVGYASLTWLPDTSPWQHICIGSDFDGLINPINRLDNINRVEGLRDGLLRYLPVADKYLTEQPQQRALRYHADGTLDNAYLEQVTDQFLYGNGVSFTARFLSNWR
ncbi:hypothetical protein [Chitinophaga nivalis]|uniref:Peptidase M19 n=1 Tax=Chitinophaga nivalis TaxID=2991709 RepID=A0ABT3IL04_9BACT|nr:hypothetical protein [Chitinophaga nivalis]MCW3465671.1 hypothetical protein [Chitinophaga nivalis]MCW3484638.1 hypothetical protein [Chitinophaga nivalis]